MAINRDKVEAAAIKLLQQGKYDKAIAELKKLVEDDPTDVRTLLKLGDTHVKMGNKKDSIESYEKAAGIYTEQGFYLKAVAVFKQILRVDSNIPELHLKLAELYQQLGLTSDALQHYHNVAVFHESQGRPRDALEMLKRMVDLDPDNLASRIKLGELFAQQGLAAEATHELRSALGFLKTQQRFDDYVRVGEKLVAYDASALDVARDLAQIYMQRAQPSVALGKLQMCFKAEPRNVEILALIAQAFLDMQQVPKTISVFKEMAKIYATDGKPDLAQRTWERVLELAPGDAEAEQALGKAPAPAPAARVSSSPGQAPVKSPAQPAVNASAATVANPVAPSGPRVNPEDEQLQRLLTETDVYVKYGLKEKAVEHLQKVFALRPDHIPALEKARTLLQAIGGGELKETVRRLVKAADKQGHPRADEWRAELARMEGARPASQSQRNLRAAAVESASVEGDVIVVEERDQPADEPFLEDDSSSTINLAGHESGIMELDPSQLDEQFGESALDSLPPDEGDVEQALDDLMPVSPSMREVPRMPTGVHGAPAQPIAQPIAQPAAVAPKPIAPSPVAAKPIAPVSPSPPSPSPGARAAPVPSPLPALMPLELSEEIVDADALVRQALQDISAEDMMAAADDLLSGEGLMIPDLEPPLAGHDDALPNVTSSTKSHSATIPAAGSFDAERSARALGSDDEIDRLARDALADANRSLGADGGGAMMSLSDAELDDIRDFEDELSSSALKKPVIKPSVPVLPLEFEGDGESFDDPTVAYAPSSSSEVPTDERPRRSSASAGLNVPGLVLAPPAPRPNVATVPNLAVSPSSLDETAPTMPAAIGGRPGLAAVSAVSAERSAAVVLAKPVAPSGFEAEASEEFDPSSFDLPPDVKELLRAGQMEVPALASVASPSLAAPLAADATLGQALGVADKAQGWEDDPANQFFPDELEESEFFIKQDLLDEAKEILQSILEDVPESGRVQWMLARVEAKENGEPEPPAPWETKLQEQILEEVQAHLDELGVLDEAPDTTAQVSVEEVLSAFKKGVAEMVPEEDAATHYELGIAYREMGLQDDAISEFQIASRAQSRAVDARYVIGLVKIDQGKFEDAVKAFDEALSIATATKDQRGAAEYSKGCALEELGRLVEALRSFKAAKLLANGAVDIDRRIKALIDKVGDGMDAKSPPGRGPKNIDYL